MCDQQHIEKLKMGSDVSPQIEHQNVQKTKSEKIN